jgi:anthranilate phosphoribosyltransferase
MNFSYLFEKIYNGEDLSIDESKAAVSQMIEGEWQPSQVGAFLVALHMKGETADELIGFVSTMREKSVRVPVNQIETMDTCGTGGDQKRSFNISTIVAFVLAGCGIPIVKHGNRAASSACGSADLMEALGIRFR